MVIRSIWRQPNWNLTMNRKHVVGIILFFISFGLHGQTVVPTFTLEGSGHVNINHYSGAEQNNGISFIFESTPKFTIEKNWRVSVTAHPGPASNNLSFPGDKLALEPFNITGPGHNLTLADLGIPPVSHLANNGEVFIIPLSPTPLVNNSEHFRAAIKFKLVVLGGQYLAALSNPDWTSYPITFVARFYGSSGEFISQAEIPYNLQVSGKLTGDIPSEDTNSIQVLGAARDGSLELRTIQDYANGASVTYENALEVKASKGYQVSVQSANPQFTTSTGKEMSLNMVSVALQPKQQGSTVYANEISHQDRLIATGNDTGNDKHLYDIRYFTKPDNQLISISPGVYSTTLIYKLTPQ